jgi:micrococcal nuclease
MYIYKAKLDRVVDGDTLDAIIDLGFDITVHKRIRLAGINTPESRTRDLEEKKRGLAAKEALLTLLTKTNQHNYFVVESEKVGKFGRVLGRLHIEVDDVECCINDQLIKDGHAVEYHGGKRK